MKKYISVLSLLGFCFILALLLASCGGGGGASALTSKPSPSSDEPAQTLDTWADLSADTRVPATDLLLAKIATTATNSGELLTSTTVEITGTLTNVTNIKVWWNTVDNFETAALVGVQDFPVIGETYNILLTPVSIVGNEESILGPGKNSGFLFYSISLPIGQSGNFQMTVSKVSGATSDNSRLPLTTTPRNIIYDGSVKWIFNTGAAPIASSAAIAPDGTMYFVSDDDVLYAMNANGTFKWRFAMGGANPALFSEKIMFIKASPAIGSDGTIYVGSVDRQIYAINPNGTLKWVIPTKTIFVSSPAIGSDGTIYIAGTESDLILICNPAISVQLSTLYAVQPDGKIKWTKTLSGAVNSSPAISSNGIIYIGSDGDISYDRSDPCGPDTFSPGGGLNIYPPSNADWTVPVGGHLYAINSNGTLRWDFKTFGDVDSSPAIGTDGTIYVGSDAREFGYGPDSSSLISINPSTEGFLYAIAPNGTLKWLRDLYGDVNSSPAVGSDGTIYVGSDKNDFFALNPINGSFIWVFPTRGNIISSPAIVSDGTIYIGSDDANLYALNPDGTVKWQLTSGDVVQSSPSIGNDGTIYIGSNDSNIYAVGGIGMLMESAWPKFRHDLRNTGKQ